MIKKLRRDTRFKKEDQNQTSIDKNYNVGGEMENITNEVNGRLDLAEERINEFEDIAIEMIQNETQRVKIMR